MADLSIEYRGSTIRFNENSDEWSCLDHNARNPSLAKLKDKISRVVSTSRKVEGGVKAVRLAYGERGIETEILARAEKTRFNGGEQVWVREKDGAKFRRSKVALAEIHDTPENWEVIQQANELDRQAKVLNDKATAMRQAIPRLKLDDLAGLATDEG